MDLNEGNISLIGVLEDNENQWKDSDSLRKCW
jgi:hypothetical protein